MRDLEEQLERGVSSRKLQLQPPYRLATYRPNAAETLWTKQEREYRACVREEAKRR